MLYTNYNPLANDTAHAYTSVKTAHTYLTPSVQRLIVQSPQCPGNPSVSFGQKTTSEVILSSELKLRSIPTRSEWFLARVGITTCRV